MNIFDIVGSTGLLGMKEDDERIPQSINIAAMQLYRASRGGNAVMILELDQEIPQDALKWIEKLEGVEKVTYYSLKGDKIQ